MKNINFQNLKSDPSKEDQDLSNVKELLVSELDFAFELSNGQSNTTNAKGVPQESQCKPSNMDMIQNIYSRNVKSGKSMGEFSSQRSHFKSKKSLDYQKS